MLKSNGSKCVLDERMNLKKYPNYGWIIVFGAFIGWFSWATSRYLYPYVLPAMKEDLNVPHVSMGSITSAYFVAYTVMTFVWGILADKIGPRKCMLIGQIIILIGLLGMGFMSSLNMGLLAYFLCGAGAAGISIPIARLLSDWFSGTRRGTAMGIAGAGGNTVTVILGFIVPMILSSYIWRWSWWLCAILVAVISVVTWFIVVDSPADRGLAPIGSNAQKQPHLGRQHLTGNHEQKVPRVTIKDVLRRGSLWNLAGIYITYGIGYVIFITFAVAHLQEIGWEVKEAAAVFAAFGALGIPGPLICGIIADRVAKKYLLAALAALEGIGIVVFLSGGTVGSYLGAMAVGFVSPSIPVVMAASMGDYFKSTVIGTTFGFVTFIFGIGCIIAPALGGAIADATGALSSAILWGLGAAALSFFLALILKKPPKRQDSVA
ncbi:nitrate/nitrite transporter [Chloroflexota bacterium]